MVRYSRFMSLSSQFESLEPINYALASSASSTSNADQGQGLDIIGGLPKRRGCPKLRNTYTLMDTTFRIRYALKIQDWVCLFELIQDLDRFAEIEKSTYGIISGQYIEALVMMLDNKLLWSTDEEMSIRDAEALRLIREKLLKYKTQYNDMITSLREAPPEEEECGDILRYNHEHETEIGFKPFPYYEYHQDNNQPYWVKGEDEIEWERVEIQFWDIPNLKGERMMEQIKQMAPLVKSAVTPSQKLRFILRVIKAQLATNPTFFTPMSSNLWKDCVLNMFVALDILAHYPNISVINGFISGGPWKYESKKTAAYKGKIRVEGELLTIIVKIYFEFDMGLRFISPDTQCYWDRLKDEAQLFLLFNNFMDYFTWNKDFVRSVRVAFLLLELVYHKSQADYDLLLKRVNLVDFGGSGKTETGHKKKYVQASTVPVPRRPNFPEDCRKFVDNLVSVIYKHGNKSTRLQTLIYDLYHYALIGDFSNATYLLSSTDLDYEVQDLDRAAKLNYNRATAQLGLCAFRAGAIQSAYSTLSDLYHTGMIDEMLAQYASQSCPHVKELEHKMFEPLGKVPYHMHMDLELLKAVHLICAMLLRNLETAVNTHDSEGNFSSKRETSDPESVIYQVKAANEALKKGNFRKSFDIVESLDCLRLLWREEGVLEMLYANMKKEALKYYLVTCSKFYSVHLEDLARWFHLSEADYQEYSGWYDGGAPCMLG